METPIHTEQLQTEIFAEYLILKGFSSKTRLTIMNTCKRFAKWVESENLELSEMTYNDLVGYVNHCKQQGHKQRTLQITTNSIKHYYIFLLSRKEITDNPCTNIDVKGIKRKVLHETFSPEELDNMYKNYKAENQLIYKRNKIILGLIIYQALRAEDLGQLSPQNIHTREGKIFVPGSRRINERELTLESHQVYDMIDYINETRKIFLAMRSKPTEALFLSFGGSDIIHNMLTKIANGLQKQDSRIKDIKQIRASVITNWIKVHNIRKVQYMAGHRYISSTEGYKANDMDALKEDINKYHPDF